MAKVIVQHHVADYDRWFPVFNEHEAARRQHGATGHSIGRDVSDPNTIVIVNDFATVEGARASAGPVAPGSDGAWWCRGAAAGVDRRRGRSPDVLRSTAGRLRIVAAARPSTRAGASSH